MGENSNELEGLITKTLKPLKVIKLNLAIEALSGHQVIEFNHEEKKD